MTDSRFGIFSKQAVKVF